jgi:hypothetical protein
VASGAGGASRADLASGAGGLGGASEAGGKTCSAVQCSAVQINVGTLGALN